MSSRVLKVRPGIKYRHTFYDDLESFFWVIFHSAAAHLDSKDAIPTDAAWGVINELDRFGLTNLGLWKSAVLCTCFDEDGDEIKDQLQLFDNTWASDPIFINTIVRFGAYLKSIKPKDYSLSKYSPAVVFPTVVDIILSQLE
jgi:hypothetical protein